jgi:3-isopropylmalate dehydrogenase
LAGKDLANPFAAALTVGMMLTYFGHPELERDIEDGVRACIVAEECTQDVGGKLGTRAAGEALRARLGAAAR